MAPCPYVYEVVAKMALDDQNLNRDSVTSKWFDFYSTEMRPLIEVFDNLLDELTNCTEQEKKILKKVSYKVLYMNVISLIWLILMNSGTSEATKCINPKLL